MKKSIVFFLFITFVLVGLASQPVKIEEIIYEGSPHFRIITGAAIYFFDQAGGGISRLLDKNGNDWVAFHREPWNKVPESAASSFRGIPNAVFRGDDGGCGHPGFDQCISDFESPNIIRSKSKSGKWEWIWEFYDDCAIWRVLKTDIERNYWFLYEGPVGGTYSPFDSFWGNNEEGICFDYPDHLAQKKKIGNWQWAYFGRNNYIHVLTIAQMSADEVDDSFSYMGNSSEGINSPDGMVVFGFGRSFDGKPLLKGNQSFIISFFELETEVSELHEEISKFIQSRMEVANKRLNKCI